MLDLAVITFLGLKGLWAIGAYVGASIGLSYLGQALFGQDIKEPEQPEDAHGRIWNPKTTQQEGLVKARCCGRNMHHGNVIAKWTDVDGDEREILYLLLEHGDGPTKGNVADQLWLNDQPIANFGSVVVQERVGTMDQTCMAGFEKLKLEDTTDTELIYNEPYYWTTRNKFFDDIEYTLSLPNGLLKRYKDGGWTTGYITVRVRIRVHPAGEWQELFNDVISIKTMSPVFRKYIVNTQSPGTVVRGTQYDLEFTNLSPPKEKLIRNIFVRSVREVVDVAFTHPGKALTGIKAIATAPLSGSLDVKVIREDRLVNVWDGETWTIEYSRNRAWVAFDLLTQPVIKGNVGTWEVARYEGSDPSYMDLAFFLEWADFCSDQVPDGYGGTEDRLACDIKVDYLTDVWTIVNEIAAVGRAHLYWAGNILTGWIDKEVTGPTDLVTMDTIMARTWKNKWPGRDELSGLVEVWYYDKRLGYERTPATLPKATAGSYTRPKSIEGVGITTYGTAIHVANHALTRNAIIKNINGFRQFKDGFRHKLGEVIRLQHRTPKWGQGYRVVSVPTASTVTLDRVVEDVNAGDLLYVRSYDEANSKVDVSVYTVAGTAGATVTIDETWSPTPIKNNIAAIGVDGKIVTRRIVKIETLVENYFEVEVETYDAALYDADDLDPDAPNKDYIWSRPPGTLAKPVTHDEVVDLFNALLPPQPDIEIPWPANLEWTGDEIDTISWAARDEDDSILFRLRGVTYEIDPAYNNDTTDEFIYWDPNFTDRFRTTNLVTVATAAGNWYMCRNVDGVPYPANAMMLAHIGVLLAGFIKVGTADIEDLAVTTAKIDDLAVETLKIKDEAVTVPASVSGLSLYFTTTGRSLYIHASGIVYVYQTGDDGWSQFGFRMKVKRDSTVLYDTGVMFQHTYLRLTQKHIPWSAGVTDDPSAGSYTYSIEFWQESPDGDCYLNTPALFIIETKK